MWLRVSFPSGRYYAARAEDPAAPEWPPHPSRVFSALVAAAYRSDRGMTAERRMALEWLESLPPPFIAAPPSDLTSAPICYVPPGDCDKEEHVVHRSRQPRYFPSAVILGEPVIGYGWEQEPDDSLLAALVGIAAGVSHVGASHSIALLEFGVGALSSPASLYPTLDGGVFLRVPVSGRLAELDALYAGQAGVRRPIPIYERLAAYRARASDVEQLIPARLELISLRLIDNPYNADRAADLARAVRRAVMAVLGNSAPDAIHGHGIGDHVAWLPLPDVGHPYAKGRIIGLGLGLPIGLSVTQRTEILAGIARLDGVRLLDRRIAQLSPLAPGEQCPKALQTKTWTGPATVWATVTPVVLDRPPKRADTERLRVAVAQSLQYAGYPVPVEVAISPFSVFQGAPPAFRVPSPERKPRYHAVVHFAKAVTGPVIAGRLRYFGVGLFRPWIEREQGASA